MSSEIVTLTSSDGKEFKINKEVACMSEYIKELVKNEEGNVIVPALSIQGDVLEKVLSFCTLLIPVLTVRQ